MNIKYKPLLLRNDMPSQGMINTSLSPPKILLVSTHHTTILYWWNLEVGACEVTRVFTRVFIDIGSSVDLIFKDTLEKMGVDLQDMKPSARSLNGFNGSSKAMPSIILLPLFVGDITWNVKFSVINRISLQRDPWHSVDPFNEGDPFNLPPMC